MKTILVPVDFSKHSENALVMASAFAKAYNAEIILLHMMGLADTFVSQGQDKKQEEGMYHMRLARQQFKTFLEKKELKGIKVREMVQSYKVFEDISDFAVEQKVDLIIMGSHGVTNLRDKFVGSNTERVVQTADIPVLVIKGEVKPVVPKSIVFASDFKIADLMIHTDAIRFFNTLGSKVSLVYINRKGDHFESTWQTDKRIKEFLQIAEFGNEFDPEEIKIINDYSIEGGIYYYAEKIGADALGIITHGNKGLSHFFYGSVAEHLANHSNLPVYTFKL
jgi:nucleotide-binding universal stress UspA family protein